MQDLTVLVIAIATALLTWTASIIWLVIWLTDKFRALELTVHSEVDKYRQLLDEKIDDHAVRIQRLEDTKKA